MPRKPPQQTVDAYSTSRDAALHALADHMDRTLRSLKEAGHWANDGITHQRHDAWDRGYDVGFAAGKAAGVNLAGAKQTARHREIKEHG